MSYRETIDAGDGKFFMKDWLFRKFKGKIKSRTEEEIEKWETQQKFIKTFRPMLEQARLTKFNFSKYIQKREAKNVPEPKAMRIIREWSKTNKRILILSSPPGTGKTFASAFYLYCAWKTAFKHGFENWSIFFVKEQELFGPLGFKGDLKEAVIEYLKSAQLLVVDDFGQVIPNDERKIEEMRIFYEGLFDKRRIMKPVEGLKVPRLILTTNLSREEIENLPYISRRVWSRISSITIFRQFTDRDYRKLGFPDFLPSEPKLY
ncbi:DNA replication protein DnaC [Balnearium lithotrophicum]|uniref:DNA replication protein DnaC n=1 Tax=Balnearium lithotrophicum TaxID=223788 RepID=A0A521CM22_9BACT|nr:ATP-binding protein [Balnearium lithotrophicum]SMO59811.1 DNA replication protein DnaC [Balnearium lithotrophicum]